MVQRKKEVDGDLFIPGSITVLGGINSSAYRKTVTTLSRTEGRVDTVEGTVSVIEDAVNEVIPLPPTENVTNIALTEAMNNDGSLHIDITWDYAPEDPETVSTTVVAGSAIIYMMAGVSAPLALDTKNTGIPVPMTGTGSYSWSGDFPARQRGDATLPIHYRFGIVAANLGTREVAIHADGIIDGGTDWRDIVSGSVISVDNGNFWNLVTGELRAGQSDTYLQVNPEADGTEEDPLVRLEASGGHWIRLLVSGIKLSSALIESITAATAFITSLFAKKIRIEDGGAIYSGGYDEEGDNSSGLPGFHLSSTGQIKAVQSYLDNAVIDRGFIKTDYVGGWAESFAWPAFTQRFGTASQACTAIMPNGSIAVGRRDTNTSNIKICFTSDGTSFTADETITITTEQRLALASLPDGRLILYSNYSTSMRQRIRGVDGVWGAFTNVASNMWGIGTPAACSLTNGKVLVTYRTSATSNPPGAIIRRTDGTYSTTYSLNTGSRQTCCCQLSTGLVLILDWLVADFQETSLDPETETYTIIKTGTFSIGMNPGYMTALPDGRALLIAQSGSDPSYTMRYTIRAANGTWGTSTAIPNTIVSSAMGVSNARVMPDGRIFLVLSWSSYLRTSIAPAYYTEVALGRFSSALGAGIIETGQNTNGYYIKFSDGTLQQWIPQLDGPAGNVTWTFPVPFINTDYAGSATCWLAGTNTTGYMVNFQNNESRSVSSLRMRRVSDSGTSSTIRVTCVVFGRWK